MIMSVEVSRRHLPRLSSGSHKDLDKHILSLVSSLSILSHLNLKHFFKKYRFDLFHLLLSSCLHIFASSAFDKL